LLEKGLKTKGGSNKNAKAGGTLEYPRINLFGVGGGGGGVGGVWGWGSGLGGGVGGWGGGIKSTRKLNVTGNQKNSKNRAICLANRTDN